MSGKRVPRVAVVTVSHESEEEVSQLYAFMRTETWSDDVQFVVVSNSNDCQSLSTRPGVEVIQSGWNAGFARGCNLGVRSSRSGFVAFCNPDLRVSLAVLHRLCDLLDSDPGMGLVAPVLGNEPMPDAPVVTTSDRIIGACIVMKRQTFEEVGGWDESYFLWGEDRDLCTRIRRLGLTCAIAPSLSAAHASQHSTSPPDLETRAFLSKVWVCSQVNYRLRHSGIVCAYLYCTRVLVVDGIRALLRADGSRGRAHHVPRAAAGFAGRLLASSPARLRSMVTFSDQGYRWRC